MLLNTLLAFTLINVTPQKIKEWGQKKQVLVRVFFFFFFLRGRGKKYFSKRSRHKFNPQEKKYQDGGAGGTFTSK